MLEFSGMMSDDLSSTVFLDVNFIFLISNECNSANTTRILPYIVWFTTFCQTIRSLERFTNIFCNLVFQADILLAPSVNLI